MLDLARSGKRVLFLSPDKGVSPTSEDTDYFNARAGALPSTIRDKASAVALLLEHLGATNVNMIGHSQGGAVATALTGMRPKLVDRLILDNPAGLIGEDSVKDLIHRVANEARGEASVESTVSHASGVAWKQIKKIARLPLFRATKEIPGIAHTDIRPILEQMQKEKSQGRLGPEIILINSNNDQIFKTADVEMGLGTDLLTQYVDRWVMYKDKNAGHGKINRQDGELLTQVLGDDAPIRTSVIHQIITEKSKHVIKNAE